MDTLFVVGVPKTGTSTMVGILNCHPDIFIMHEWLIDNFFGKNKRYLFEFCPKIKEDFGDIRRIESDNVFELYQSLYKYFYEQGFKYRYFGDKWVSVDTLAPKYTSWRLNYLRDSKVIFMVRDIREWLCHNKIRKIYYNTENNIVSPALEYTKYFINSFKLNDKINIRLKDIIFDRQSVFVKLSEFLGIKDIDLICDRWWEKVHFPERDEKDYPKFVHKWWEAHGSALAVPKHTHVSVVLKDHYFWDDVLPIFDKYFNCTNSFGKEEINTDIQHIRKLESKYKNCNVKLNECYRDINIIKYNMPNFSR